MHDPEIMERAIECCKSDQMSQKDTAKAFKIPFSTLNDKIVGHSVLSLSRLIG